MKRWNLLACAVLASCAAGGGHYSGTVQTEAVSVGSQIGGRVIEVRTAAGARVHRGDVLVRLDPAILQGELDEARGELAQAQANLLQLQNGAVATDIAQARGESNAALATYRQTVQASPERIRAARAAIVDAAAGERLAQQEYDRTAALAQTGDVSQQALDQARAERDSSQARLREARASYDQLVRADIPGQTQATRSQAASAHAGYQTLANGTRPETIAQAQAQVENARGAVARAQARLAELTIASPTDGVVSSFNLHPGDMLGVNQTAAIVDTFADPYAYIYASQSDLAKLRAAKTLQVTADSGAGTFTARIEAFDRSAQFTPQNTETADTRAQLVYGVKIRIADPEHKLLDGTTVTVAL